MELDLGIDSTLEVVRIRCIANWKNILIDWYGGQLGSQLKVKYKLTKCFYLGIIQLSS